MTKLRQCYVLMFVLLPCLFFKPVNADTLVNINTTFGNIELQLYDTTAPITVTNFLSYVESGAYNKSFIHRSEPGFVVQGGGYGCNNNSTSSPPSSCYQITTKAPIVNEFNQTNPNHNVAGTIAMALTGTNINSATDQWFINLANNSSSLDPQKFTVFGNVISGMDVVNTIAGLTIKDANTYFGLPDTVNNMGPFNHVPVYGNDAFVFINSVTVVPIPSMLYLYMTVLAAGVTLTRRTKTLLS